MIYRNVVTGAFPCFPCRAPLLAGVVVGGKIDWGHLAGDARLYVVSQRHGCIEGCCLHPDLYINTCDASQPPRLQPRLALNICSAFSPVV